MWNEWKISPGGREMATTSDEREERQPGLMTFSSFTFRYLLLAGLTTWVQLFNSNCALLKKNYFG